MFCDVEVDVTSSPLVHSSLKLGVSSQESGLWDDSIQLIELPPTIIDLTDLDETVPAKKLRKRKRTKSLNWSPKRSIDDSCYSFKENVDLENFQTPGPYRKYNEDNLPTNLRVGIFCPRPLQQKLINHIKQTMSCLEGTDCCPRFKRTGLCLDVIWVVAENEYSAVFIISVVKQIATMAQWRKVPLFVDRWNDQFVTTHVIVVRLPWATVYNPKKKIIQRLVAANKAHGSHCWNFVGTRDNGQNVSVIFAVNKQSFKSLERVGFTITYGFSVCNCEVLFAPSYYEK